MLCSCVVVVYTYYLKDPLLVFLERKRKGNKERRKGRKYDKWDVLIRVVIIQILYIAGIRIMTNKPFTRSSSSPGISHIGGSPALERVSNSSRRASDGNQRQRHLPGSQSVLSAPLPYWVAEGTPLVVPSGEMQMLPVQAPGVQGMPVPVMAAPAPTSQQSGNVFIVVARPFKWEAAMLLWEMSWF